MANYDDETFLTLRCKHWFGLASAKQRADGASWYPAAQTFCRQVANDYGMDVRIVAGVVAALSPAVYWDLNKRQAEALCQAYASGGWEAADDVVLSTYGSQAIKAKRILALTVVSDNSICACLGKRAFKTVAFYHCIVGGWNQSACIDRHIVNAMGFADRWVSSAAWCYRLLESAMIRAAGDLGLQTSTLQATLWVTWKDAADAYSAAEQGVQHDVRRRGRSADNLPV